MTIDPAFIDAVFWWTGAVVCAAGATLFVGIISMLPFFIIDTIFKKWGDVYSFLEIYAEARKQGKTFWRDRP